MRAFVRSFSVMFCPKTGGNMKKMSNKAILTTKVIAYAAVSAAAVMAATLLGFSSAQFYFNLGDSLILIVSAVFGPVIGMFAGGIGSFLADLAVYPVTMFYTLVIKGLEGLFAGILIKVIKKFVKNKPLNVTLSITAMAFSAYFMMTGYFVCQTFFYGTYASALVALPMDAVQATVSLAVATIALYPLKLINMSDKVYSLKGNKKVKPTEKAEDAGEQTADKS